MTVTNPFRRSARADTKRTGGKGGKGNYYERFRLPVGTAVPFVLINAEYVDPNPAPEEVEVDAATGRPKDVKKPYFKTRKHNRKIVKNGKEFYTDEVCSAGWNPHSPQPCVGCAAMDSGDKSVGVKDVYVVGIVHLGTYHRHPLLDKNTGGLVMKRDTNQVVTVDSECTGRLCNFCRTLRGEQLVTDPQRPWPGYRREDIQTFFGKRRYIELGKNHLADLLAWDQQVSAVCGNDGAQLITDGFQCPTCSSLIIDMNQDPRTDAEIAEAVSHPYPCLTCNRPVMLREVVACDACAAANRPAKQFTLFDLVLHGMRFGEKTNSHMVLQRFETLSQFRVDPALLPQGKDLAAVLTEIAKPYDFAETFKPNSLKDQADRLSLPLPQQGYSGQQGGYGQPQQPQSPYGAPPQQGGNYGGVQQGGYPPAQQPVQGQQAPPSFAPPQMQPQQPQPPAFVPPGRPPFQR